VGIWPRITVNDPGPVINKIARERINKIGRGRISRTAPERINKIDLAPARIRAVPAVAVNPRGTHREDMDNRRIEAPATVPLAITARVATPGRTVPADNRVSRGIALNRPQAGGIGPRQEAGIAAVEAVLGRSRRHAAGVAGRGTDRLVCS
jgi:hypothetical protein